MIKTLSHIKIRWQSAILGSCFILFALALVCYKLGSLTGGLSPAELAARVQYSSFGAILSNPPNAPYKLLAWMLSFVPYNSPAMIRLPSALFGLSTLVPLAYIMRRWYGPRVMLLGLILFASSAWFLHVSRIALFDVEFLWATTTLVALHLLLHARAEKLLVFLSWLLGMLVLLFVPGMIWFVLLNIILQYNDILDAWDETKGVWLKIFVILVPLLTLAAIGYAMYRNTNLITTWLGLPPRPEQWLDMLKRFGNAFAYFVVRGPHNPVLWLGRLPILDAFMTAMLAAGILVYAKRIKASHTRLLALFFLLGAILTALSLNISFSVIVPLVYIIATAGIAYLMHEWLHVFPRNPLARSLGIGLVGLLIVASSVYNVRSYFVAWPHNTETQATFTEPLPPKN